MKDLRRGNCAAPRAPNNIITSDNCRQSRPPDRSATAVQDEPCIRRNAPAGASATPRWKTCPSYRSAPPARIHRARDWRSLPILGVAGLWRRGAIGVAGLLAAVVLGAARRAFPPPAGFCARLVGICRKSAACLRPPGSDSYGPGPIAVAKSACRFNRAINPRPERRPS